MGEEILRTEGIRGLFPGWALRDVWTMMRIELCLWSYESGRWLKGRRWLENGKGGLFELAKRGGGVILLSRGIGRNLIHGSLWRYGILEGMRHSENHRI